VLPAVRPNDGGAVLTGGVSVRHARRIDRERVPHVRVSRGTVPLELPVPGDRDGVPIQAGIMGIPPVAGRRDQSEPPVPVQRKASGAGMGPGASADHTDGWLDDFVTPKRRVRHQVPSHDSLRVGISHAPSGTAEAARHPVDDGRTQCLHMNVYVRACRTTQANFRINLFT
jgi:hypothetical protein